MDSKIHLSSINNKQKEKFFANLEKSGNYKQITSQLNGELIFALVRSGSREMKKQKKNFSDVEFVTMRDTKFRNAVKNARHELGIKKEYSAEEIYTYEKKRSVNILNYQTHNELLFREICSTHFPDIDIDNLDENNIKDAITINNVSHIEAKALGKITEVRNLKYSWDNCLQYYVLQPDLIREVKKLDKDKQDFMKSIIIPDRFMIGTPEIIKTNEDSVIVEFIKGTKRYQFNDVYDVIKPFMKNGLAKIPTREKNERYIIKAVNNECVRVKIFRDIKRKQYDEIHSLIRPYIKGNLHISEDTEKDIVTVEHKSGKTFKELKEEYYKGVSISKDTIHHKIMDTRI